ncbi:MAG: DNA integrity scanning protein DisA [Actinobacteria bacterium HGW-Actinobacteria-10]|nr:MAG: DNA integrity scanning protein DisA [Actinobacteria bacterium HGW-Actinobacteria-10]
MARVAPGTALREGIEHILSARTGALIVIGDAELVSRLCDGGFTIDTPFTPQRMFELAKMDGAIVLDAECRRIMRANVHLVPDPSLVTVETGMRHRTAERVSRQTGALVISISQRRDVVSLYIGGRRFILDEIEVLLGKANQALQTLERYRNRLDQVLRRLTALEFDDLVSVNDVAEVISRFEMLNRVATEVGRYTTVLGTEGRLIRMQSEELTAGVNEDYLLVIRDYAADPGPRNVAQVRVALAGLSQERLQESDAVAGVLGLANDVESGKDRIGPRGFRALKRIPQLPNSVIARMIDHFGTLSLLLRASEADLDAIDGVGARRARAVLHGLRRMRDKQGI